MLRVITYNIHFGRRLNDIIPWVNKQMNADVICLQEFPKRKLSDFYKRLSPDWKHKFTQSFLKRKKTYGLVTLYHGKKLRLLRSKTLLMGVNKMEKSLMGNPVEKSCLLTTFQTGSDIITVANTHLVFLAVNKSRYKQLRMITDYVRTVGHAVIITGDFNIISVRAKNKMTAIMKTLGFHTISKRLKSFRLAILRYQLDYIFGANCAIKELEALRVRYSDHFPVAATITIDPSV